MRRRPERSEFHDFEERPVMSAEMPESVQMNLTQPEAVDSPAGVDRRAFLMRSAVAGAVAVSWTGFMIASNEIPSNRRVDFDTTMSAMALTAKEMNAKYKETSEGGLAVSLVLC
jgi:hypothetical protein